MACHDVTKLRYAVGVYGRMFPFSWPKKNTNNITKCYDFYFYPLYADTLPAALANCTCILLYKCACQVLYSISAYHSPIAALMRKHHRIILNYYLKYMSGFDAQMLRNVVMVSLCLLWDMSSMAAVLAGDSSVP